MRRAIPLLLVLLLAPAALAVDHFPMPNVLGKTEDEAVALFEAAGLSHVRGGPSNDDCDGAEGARVEGKIYCQKPKPGASVDRYTSVEFDVYEAPKPEPGWLSSEQLASLRGLTVAQAQQELKRMGHDGVVEVCAGPLHEELPHRQGLHHRAPVGHRRPRPHQPAGEPQGADLGATRVSKQQARVRGQWFVASGHVREPRSWLRDPHDARSPTASLRRARRLARLPIVLSGAHAL
jgi:hypothetical protein